MPEDDLDFTHSAVLTCGHGFEHIECLLRDCSIRWSIAASSILRRRTLGRLGSIMLDLANRMDGVIRKEGESNRSLPGDEEGANANSALHVVLVERPHKR